MAKEYTYTDAHLAHREASKKLDYFQLGVTMAILAFSVEGYEALSSHQYPYLIVASWVLLLISFLSGLYRQEMGVHGLYFESKKFYYEPTHQALKEGIDKGRVILKSETGTPFSDEEIKSQHLHYEGIIEKLKGKMDITDKRYRSAYKVQKWTFVLGLILMALFKIINVF